MQPANSEELNRVLSALNGRYQIESVLGVGGMGCVYLANSSTSQSDKKIALKVILPERVTDQVSRSRFEAELAILSRLNHKHIVKVEDSGLLTDGSVFIAMEYLSGGSLSQLLNKEKKLDITTALPLLHKICQALDFAHLSGVVHRDLKPDNILFASAHNPKLTDFGLAKDQNLALCLTDTGETVGTPYYMAPEQFRGDEAAPAIDIYALGIIAYELITGRRPFVHENYVAVATMHYNHDLPEIKDKSVPTWFQEIIGLCCEKKAKHRFKSASELAIALEHYMDKLGLEVDFRFGGQATAGGIFSRIRDFFSLSR